MIIQATEDEDLAELDLPDQLAALKRVSNDCIEDIRAIKEKVAAWSQFAGLVYQACVDQDRMLITSPLPPLADMFLSSLLLETLGKDRHDLDGKIVDKKLAIGMKQERANDVKSQTEQYRGQFASRQEELTRAVKSQHRGKLSTVVVPLQPDPLSVPFPSNHKFINARRMDRL